MARDPKDYTVGEILRITEGSIAPVACLDQTPNQCGRVDSCATLKIWKGLQDVIEEYLDGITLADIQEEECQCVNDYII